MKKLNEQNILKDFKSQLGTQMGSAGVLNKEGGAVDYLNFLSEIPESEDMVKKPKKKSNVKSLVGKTKMNLPIGKLYSMGKTESKEATGASGGGQYSQPLFSTTKKEVEEKWSEKYKRSIDCSNPKGFSQKAHCQGKKKKNVNEDEVKNEKTDKKSLEDLVKKYQRKKIDAPKTEKGEKKSLDDLVKKYKKIKDSEKPIKKTETKEATGASSSGQYATTAAWAKSTSKKDWRGKSKTQIPGGKFVQVKKKCKKFPYCNQGDIKALNIFDHVEIKKVIKEVSESYGVSEQVIKNIIAYEYSQYKSNK